MRTFYALDKANKLRGLRALMRLAARSANTHFYLQMKHKYDKETLIIEFTNA